MSLLLDPKNDISIDVKFYDEQERKDFGKWANATTIETVAGHTIQVPVAEFLAYFLIHRKGLSPVLYPNLDALKAVIKKGSENLTEWISYNGKSLHVTPDVELLESSFTEHLGEAAGLSVANRIHNLTEADWVKIPAIPGSKGRKTLDWKYASDEMNFVELETKGSFCVRADRLSGLSAHKADIKAKKSDSEKKCHPYFNQRALRYGTITSISKDPESTLTVRLVDPEGDTHERTAHDARIVKRLAWASWIISLIVRRTHLSVALQNRMAVLQRVEELARYNGLPLLGGARNSMSGKMFIERILFFRSTPQEFPAPGVLTEFNEEHLLFIGLDRKWFLPLIQQQFDELSKMSFPPRSQATKIDCVVSPLQMKSLFSDVPQQRKLRGGRFVRFERNAVLHQSPAGLVFGLVAKND